jgi:uncharacterized protein
MLKHKMLIEKIPAIMYGPESEKLYLFVHGRCSKKEDAEFFSRIAIDKGFQVLSFDLPQHGDRLNDTYECSVQNCVHDLETIYNHINDKYKDFSLFACSFGAYFSLIAYQTKIFSNCLFLSPILNMERLIENLMLWANVSEKQLEEQKIVETSFGEKLSWDYYQYVKKHPIVKWNCKTSILYGENDNLTEKSVLNSFSEKFKCNVNVMQNGEHYFHTPDQIKYLEKWVNDVL